MSQIIIQERDKFLIQLLKKYEVMSTRQIQKIVFSKINYTTMMRRLRLLEKSKYIKQGVILDDYSRTWCLGLKSLLFLQSSVIYDFNNRNTIAHDTTVTELRIRLEGLGLANDWTTGLTIKAEAFRNLKFRAKQRLIPDGLMIESINIRPEAIAIELELTQKSEKRYQKILHEYQDNINLKAVWYIVSSQSIIRAMENAARSRYLKTHYLWYSYVDQILNSSDEIKIYSMADRKWHTLTDLNFDNYKLNLPAHPRDVGVSSTDVEKIKTETDANCAESATKSLTLTGHAATPDLSDHTPPTKGGVWSDRSGVKEEVSVSENDNNELKMK